jgi:hypothetical protein
MSVVLDFSFFSYEISKQLFVGGVHYPTMMVVNHRFPRPITKSVIDGSDVPDMQPSEIPMFLALPFYDTNIGKGKK